MKNLHAKREKGVKGKKDARDEERRKRNGNGTKVAKFTFHPEEDVRIFEQLDTYNFTDIRRSCGGIFYAKELKT